MSNPQPILPTTGGGILFFGLFYDNVFLTIAGILLLMTVTSIVLTLKNRYMIGERKVKI
jgi:hypothetical protein